MEPSAQQVLSLVTALFAEPSSEPSSTGCSFDPAFPQDYPYPAGQVAAYFLTAELSATIQLEDHLDAAK